MSSMLQSNDEYFAAIHSLASHLDELGKPSVGDKLRQCVKHINRLTDGWAAHLECLLAVESTVRGQLTDVQRVQLAELCDAAYQAVYRKRRR